MNNHETNAFADAALAALVATSHPELQTASADAAPHAYVHAIEAQTNAARLWLVALGRPDDAGTEADAEALVAELNDALAMDPLAYDAAHREAEAHNALAVVWGTDR